VGCYGQPVTNTRSSITSLALLPLPAPPPTRLYPFTLPFLTPPPPPAHSRAPFLSCCRSLFVSFLSLSLSLSLSHSLSLSLALSLSLSRAGLSDVTVTACRNSGTDDRFRGREISVFRSATSSRDYAARSTEKEREREREREREGGKGAIKL